QEKGWATRPLRKGWGTLTIVRYRRIRRKGGPPVLNFLLTILNIIDTTGKPPAGHQGGRPFRNDKNYLPHVDGNGNPITYKEWDVYPQQNGVNRGAERMVTGSDGSAYYTDTHYGQKAMPAFQKIR